MLVPVVLMLSVCNGLLAALPDSLASAILKKYDVKIEEVEEPGERQSVLSLRDYFRSHAYRFFSDSKELFRKDLLTLQPDGRFSDLRDEDAGVCLTGNQAESGGSITIAYDRVRRIAEAFRNGKLSYKKDKETILRLYRAILHYGGMEIVRPNDDTRFHASCFAIPTAAVNTYFCLLPAFEERMDRKDRELSGRALIMLKANALQAWTQPYRKDDTDKDVTLTDRFRNHVWWVGGNALAYRPLLPVAVMLNSPAMIKTLVEVCHKGISQTSQTTNKTSFWNEGFTADGAGWGHGKQCLIWGYPIDGTMNALNILSLVKGTVWDRPLGKEETEALLQYFRGANFYYYKGYIPPCLDRNSMNYKARQGQIRYGKMVAQLLHNWKDSFTADEQRELEMLHADLQDNDIQMEGDHRYNGVRCFFNNDDMIKKTSRYHLFVNMASSKCDGIESADGFADGYNFFTNDGLTLFQKDGTEYNKAIGAADVTLLPGITAREGMDKLTSVTNWRGFSSKYRFGGSTSDGETNGVAGFIFEKFDGSAKPDVNDRGNSLGKNAGIFGVKAYKSYFVMGDYLICLGAGVTNLQPELEGNIRTSIEQTECTDSIYKVKAGGLDWVGQKGKFAYSVFPEYAGRMKYSCEEKKTEWEKRNVANKGRKDLPQQVRLFSVWFEHGRKPVDDKYGYIVCLGENLPVSAFPYSVLANTEKIQAVSSSGGELIGAVIYDEKETIMAPGNMSVSVSSPCILLMQKTDKGYRIDVTDPLMDENCHEITVTVGGRKVVCRMPDGKLKGKPATVNYEVGK